MLLSRTLQPLQRHRVLTISRHVNRRHGSTLADALGNKEKKVHSFISRSRDPYLNLSIEHYLLTKSAHDTTILFLYTNRPSIVIGRNQNPWMEVNLGLLRAARSSQRKETEPPGLGELDLVRRRSGGGTVFHDEGNVNWGVVSPSETFSRDKHAEMVVRALRKLGVERARVNERHDIVLDQGANRMEMDEADTHKTPFGDGPRPLKVSGSAYKLIRGRALHHATCLLSSPNLHIIPDYLHSPAKPFIKAQGVESVSSPVANIGIENSDFMEGVQKEFGSMYGLGPDNSAAVELGEEQLDVPEIRKGYEELKTLSWTYLSTPKFVFSTNEPLPDGRRDTVLPPHLKDAQVTLTVHNGAIKDGRACLGPHGETRSPSQQSLEGLNLHEIDDWRPYVESEGGREERDALANWLRATLPSPLEQ